MNKETREWLREAVRDTLFVCGTGLVVAGLWQMWAPMGWLAGGVALVATALALRRD